MSIDTKVTVSGWVGTQPRHVVSQNGTSFTVFRMGSTKRYYDRSQECWVDGATTWYTVKTWRTAAVNVAESLRRSDPVLVHGSLATETWESPEGPRTSLVVEADALGPDLTRGQATFRHTVHVSPAASAGTQGTAATTAAHDGGGGADAAGSGHEQQERPLHVLSTAVADDPWDLGAGRSADGTEAGTVAGTEAGTMAETGTEITTGVTPETELPLSA